MASSRRLTGWSSRARKQSRSPSIPDQDQCTAESANTGGNAAGFTAAHHSRKGFIRLNVFPHFKPLTTHLASWFTISPWVLFSLRTIHRLGLPLRVTNGLLRPKSSSHQESAFHPGAKDLVQAFRWPLRISSAHKHHTASTFAYRFGNSTDLSLAISLL